MKYVIWLTNESASSLFNSYGYWTGKNYTMQYELFPVTNSHITPRTKIYTSEKRAKNALEACLERGYAYVTGGNIEAIQE